MIGKHLENTIRRVVREELERALVRDITVEVRRDDPGNPKIETKRMSVLDYMLICCNRTEGALRGMQSDVGRTKNVLGTVAAIFREMVGQTKAIEVKNARKRIEGDT